MLAMIFRAACRLHLALVLVFALPAPARAGEPPRVLHPALWKIADADTTIWLFGTIHLLRPGFDWLNGPLAQAVDGADEVVTEVLDPTGAETQAALIRRATLSRGETLRGLLDAGRRARLEAALAQAGMPPESLDPYKPWYAAVALTSLPLLRRGFSTQEGVEAAIGVRAEQHEHRRGALETVDEQLRLLDGLPRTTQLAYLDAVVADFDRIDAEVDAMFEAWGAGDPEKLAQLMNAQEDDPALADVLLTARNRRWAAWIRQRLDQPGTVLVAVGAGHLAGPDSVQAMLAAGGIAAVRVQ